jgi:hypothetical protein
MPAEPSARQGGPTRRAYRGGRSGRSQAFPLILGDTGLGENALEQRQTDIGLMWIRERELEAAFLHELVLATGIGAAEATLAQSSDEVLPFGGAKCGH